MPTVYRAQCQSCGSSPEASGGVAAFVSRDGEGGEGKILSDGYTALELDDGQIICLPHPLESSTLEKQGYTWRKAAREGRLLNIQYKICTNCGTLCEQPRVIIEVTGCLYTFLPGAVIFLAMIFLLHSSWLVALIFSYLAVFTIDIIVSRYRHRRWRKKNAAFGIPHCQSCKGKNFTSIPKAVGKPVMCAHCHTPNMKFSIAGIS